VANSKLVLVTYDGAAVWGRWEEGNAANPFVFALFEDGVELQRNTVQYGPQSKGPFSASIAIGPRLDPAKRYEVAVSRGNGPESFDTRLPLIVRAPLLESLDFDGTRIRVVARAPSEASQVLVASLWTGEREITRVRGSASEVTITPDAPLEGWREPYLRLHHESSTSVGRMGEAIALVATTPEPTWTAYDGRNVIVRWRNPSGKTAPTGARVQLLAGGAKIAEVDASGNEAEIPAPGLNPAASHSVTIRATRGSIIGPVSKPATVISAMRSLDAVTVAGGFLTATLSGSGSGQPEAGVDRFELELRSDAVAVARASVGAGGGIVAGPFDPERTYSLAVRALGEGRSGPLGAVAGVVLVTPQATSIVTSATVGPTITVTLADKNPAPAWVTRTRASLLRNDQVIAEAEAAGTTLALVPSGAIDPAGVYAVRLQALGDHGGRLSGPIGATIPVVVHAPEITEARWSGQAVRVSWRPLAQAGLLGYTVALRASDGSGTTSPVVTADTRAMLAFRTPAAGVTYTVTVVAHTALCTGPAQASPSVVAMRPRPAAWFVSSQGVARVFRADPRDNPSAARAGTVTLLLSGVFAGTPAALPSVGGFTLRSNADAKLPHALVVDLAASGIAADEDAARLAGRRAFEQFLAALELTNDNDGKRALARDGITLVRQAAARGLPLAFADTLFFAYGLDPQRRTVDLLPGMRLRVDASAYQLVPPNPALTNTLSGHVAQGSIYYELSSGGADGRSSITSADAFLSRVLGVDVDPALSKESGGQDTGLDGTVDLMQRSLRRAWLRLVYPTKFSASNQKGSIGTQGSVALVAADTRAALETASRAVSEAGSFAGSLEATATFFRGRAALIPEILISLDGQSLHVPVGTTVRQLIGRQHVVSSPGSGIAMTRCLGGLVEVADDLADGPVFDRREPVMLDHVDCFDLPLLHGDALTTRGT
jgi:hypothetical protein